MKEYFQPESPVRTRNQETIKEELAWSPLGPVEENVFKPVKGYIDPDSSYKNPDNRDREKLYENLSIMETTLKSLREKRLLSRIPILRRFLEKEEKWATFRGLEGKEIGNLYRKVIQRLGKKEGHTSKKVLEGIGQKEISASEEYKKQLGLMEKCNLIRRRKEGFPLPLSDETTPDYWNQDWFIFGAEYVEEEIVAPTEFGKKLERRI